MALEICDIIYVDFHFNQQTYHIEAVLESEKYEESALSLRGL